MREYTSGLFYWKDGSIRENTVIYSNYSLQTIWRDYMPNCYDHVQLKLYITLQSVNYFCKTVFGEYIFN